VWFAYTPDRKGEHPQAHLSKFRGTLQADGYAGFEQIYEAGRNSLIGSARLNGIDPQAYLRDVLSHIADHPINRIEDLLSWNLTSESAPNLLR
jgi:hypothetical protein